jgi:hypothetical protein
METVAPSYTAGLRAISIIEFMLVGEKMNQEGRRALIMVGLAGLATVVCMGLGFFVG